MLIVMFEILSLVTFMQVFSQSIELHVNMKRKLKTFAAQELTLRSCAQSAANDFNLRYATIFFALGQNPGRRRMREKEVPTCSVSELSLQAGIKLQESRGFPAYWPNWVVYFH